MSPGSNTCRYRCYCPETVRISISSDSTDTEYSCLLSIVHPCYWCAEVVLTGIGDRMAEMLVRNADLMQIFNCLLQINTQNIKSLLYWAGLANAE